MKKCQKDEILQLAFGDGNLEQIEELRENSPEAYAELQALRNLSYSLKSMPVPECQLSTERLRGSILNSGLNSPVTSRSSWIRLAWIPVAVFALAAIGSRFVLRSAAPEAATVVASNQASDPLSHAFEGVIDFEPGVWDRATVSHSEDTSAAVSVSENAAPAASIVRRTPVRRWAKSDFTASRHRSRPEPVALAGPTQDLPPATDQGNIAPNSVPMEATGGSSAALGVVVIGSEQDQVTGANRAIEVADGSALVIGG